MRSPLLAALALSILFLAPLPAHAEPLSHVADEYFDSHYHFHPTDGTMAGFHQYDSHLEDLSAAGHAEEIQALHGFLRRFQAVPTAGLSVEAGIDRDLLVSHIQGDLLELETVRQWQKNPDQYTGALTTSAFSLISRSFQTPDERLQSLIAREQAMPAVLDAARENLRHCPKEFATIALQQLPDSISFFQNDVPAAFKTVEAEPLVEQFRQTNTAVINALTAYQDWIKSDIVPHADGDFRIGADNYARMLRYNEMVDVPLDRLLALGTANMHANQHWFGRVAHDIDPHRPATAILADLQRAHPRGDQLLDSFRHTLGGLKSFIDQHHIVTIPSPVLPILEETPPFDRALTSASMDIPGAYELQAKEAYFNVTLPEPTWTQAQTDDYMGGFNYGTIVSTAVHEAYPGHYVQYLWLQRLHDKVRKLVTCDSNSEGWAHYTEQMMLDQGYGAGDKRLRLGQLEDALLRNARLVVGIQMHRGRMTLPQAIDFFVREGYQTRTNAQREAMRGTSDPTYLVYTMGKLEIMKLRDDYRRLHPHATLGQFHDDFLRQGIIPIRLIRRVLLGHDGPVL